MKSKMKWGIQDLVLAVIGLVPIGYYLAVYDRMPETMATHFGISGDANGWMSKGAFLIFIILFSLGLPLFMKVTRRIDPRSENYDKFDNVYEIFRLGVTLVVATAMVGIILINQGYTFSMQMYVLIGLGLFLMTIGNYMGQIRFNYFIGIKTPWTLANEEVWRRTHRASGPLIVIAGIVSIVSAFLPNAVAVWVFGVVFAFSMLVFPLVYSYRVFVQVRNGDGK